MTRAAAPSLPLFGPPQGWLTAIYKKRFLFLLVVANPEYFRDDFMSWLSENFRVWSAFELEADKVWEAGRRRYSARTIGEFLRHQTNVRQSVPGEEWKVNDHYWPDLARLWMLLHPERDGFFERRAGPLTLRAA